MTPATALRYERHDRKVRQMTKEEELGIGKDKRKIDLKEEYYVRPAHLLKSGMHEADMECRNLQPKTWIIGSRSESRDFQAKSMAYWSDLKVYL